MSALNMLIRDLKFNITFYVVFFFSCGILLFLRNFALQVDILTLSGYGYR